MYSYREVRSLFFFFPPTSPVPNILPGICVLLFLGETSGADTQQDKSFSCSVEYKLTRRQTNPCIDLLARSAFSMELQRERANWFIRHVLHNWQGKSPGNYTGGLNCSITGSSGMSVTAQVQMSLAASVVVMGKMGKQSSDLVHRRERPEEFMA